MNRCRFGWVGLLGIVVGAAGCSERPAVAPRATKPVAADAAASDAPSPAAAAPPKLLTDAELADGWIALFDGETLFGWRHDHKADWRVEQGAIVVSEGEKGLLVTTVRYRDYVLKVDFRSAPGTNSGIFLRTPPVPANPAEDCYELNIADSDNPFPTGSLVQRRRAEGNFDSADWQSYEVTVAGADVTVKLDGETVLEYTDPQPLGAGHIGLQLNSGRVQFRNVKLKPLGLQTLFNGRDLAGWKTYPEMASEFTVGEGETLNVKNGRGQLETEATYDDFVLQLECISHAAGLNSGIFFRCVPGETMNGYESQIHNGCIDGDRTRPVDCGTGGIFRRANARRVVADDLEWFHKTIVADGADFAVWVNGYQVTAWTDDRDPHPNPRQGLRREPGTLMIQGHDPTTNLSFRDIAIGGMGE